MNYCSRCEYWRRAESLVPINYGACGNVPANIFDFTGIQATVRRIGRPGQSLECEPVEFVTSKDFSCSSFEPRKEAAE